MRQLVDPETYQAWIEARAGSTLSTRGGTEAEQLIDWLCLNVLDSQRLSAMRYIWGQMDNQ